jgi:hypothetical protein
MPLPRYGVAIGGFVDFTRDPQHDFGSWYHGHVTVDAGGVRWASALDVDAPAAVGVAYRLVTGLHRSDLGALGSRPLGWTDLAPTATSGALDYVRSPILRNGFLVRTIRRIIPTPKAPADWRPPPPDVGLPGGPDPSRFEPAPFQPDLLDRALGPTLRLKRPFERLAGRNWLSFPWIDSDGDNALDALEPHARAASRIYLFGEHYEDGTLGVHDVHMNQGDPSGSSWHTSNGTWQDGAVACERADQSVVIWQVRFKTQSLNTDDNGYPV